MTIVIMGSFGTGLGEHGLYLQAGLAEDEDLHVPLLIRPSKALRKSLGWGELEGVACRTDFDLKRHSEASGTDLLYFDPQTKEKYTPYVIEPAGGINRMALTFMIDAYEEEELEKDTRTVLHFHPRIAPITVAIFPLVKKEGMPERAREILGTLQDAGIRTFYDQKGAIGRRYRRQDEVGTPWCLTVDGDTLADNTVTIRDRDSMDQVRVPIDELLATVSGKLGF